MTDEERWAQWPEETRPDYCITLTFKPGVERPQRIFKAASDFIESLQALDVTLVSAIDSKIQPVFLLERIESGSVKIWVKQVLNAIPDDAIRSLDWKTAVGAYLVDAKHYILRHLDENKSLGTKREFSELAETIHNSAINSGALKYPAYKKIPASDIAKSMSNICDSVSSLEEGERITISSDSGDSGIDHFAKVTQDQIDSLLTNNVIKNSTELILMVRKPDFLGTSMWEFRHDGKSVNAKITHEEWLRQFLSGHIDIRPGDALRVHMDDETHYGDDGEVIRSERTIVKVSGVIKTNHLKLEM